MHVQARATQASADEPRADMTPMIDVVFQLLIFFLCTLRYRALEGRLEAFLPHGAGASAPPSVAAEPLEVEVRVLTPGERRDPRDLARPWSGTGRFEWVGRSLAYRLGPRTTRDLHELGAWLPALLGATPARKTRVDARPGTTAGDVVPLLDALVDAGASDIEFTRPGSGPERD